IITTRYSGLLKNSNRVHNFRTGIDDGSERPLADLRTKTPLSLALLEMSSDVSTGHPMEDTFSRIVDTRNRAATVSEPLAIHG
uniref:Uncharacterized protein n=1 Tax=Romanomermis culicivorax TaxID=13658 RepID=A0A915KSG4_ROMCU